VAGDLARLDSAIKELQRDVRMIVIDPITSYMGRIDSHRTTDVRGILEPLAEYADRTGLAVIAISHPPKTAPAKALHAVTGSYAYVAAARMVFLVATDPDDDTRRLLLPIKNNLAPLPAGLGYRLEQRPVAEGVVGSHIIWDSKPVTITADAALAADAAGSEDRSAKSEAMEFLRNALAGGPAPAAEVDRIAHEHGITPKTLRSAREALRVRIERDGFGPGSRSLWSLPEEGA
jgi:putative DNA primase/helicase